MSDPDKPPKRHGFVKTTLLGALLEPPLQARSALKERAAEARHNGMTAIADGVAAASIGETTKVSNPVWSFHL